MTARNTAAALVAAAAVTASGLGAEGAAATAAGSGGRSAEPVQNVSPVGRAQFAPTLAITGDRQAAAAWNQGLDPDRLWLAASQDGVWSAPVQVPGARRPLEQRIAAAGHGRLLVAWVDGRTVMTATRRPDGGWSAPLRVASTPSGSREGSYPGYLALDANAQGQAVLAWETVDDDADRFPAPAKVRAVVRNADGTWTPARTLSTPRRQGVRPEVFVDARGRVTAVWHQFGRRPGRVWSARWRPGRGWSGSAALSRVGTGLPRLAGLPSGRTVVAWCGDPRRGGGLFLRRGTPTGGWRPVHRAPARIPRCGWMDAGLDARGRVTVAWTNDRSAVWAVDRTISRWRPAVRVARRGSVFSGLELVENRDGDTALGWQTWTGRRHAPQVARRPAGARWHEPVTVAPAGDTSGPALAVSGRGDVLVGWVRDRGGEDLTQVQARWLLAR